MFLVDTDVISEARKGTKANPGVQEFLDDATRNQTPLYLSAVTVGELRQGVESIRHRGDAPQALQLSRWLDRLMRDYAAAILAFDADVAQVWGRLRVPNPDHPLDKQIAATALIYDLVVATRNTAHYAPTGVRVLNPFS
jgi:predicted nucleic acid-binding protein